MSYDRTGKLGGTISNDNLINQYSLHLQFMQAARDEVVLDKFEPFSLFSFECQTSKEPQANFDYVDDGVTMVAGIRFGKVGLIVTFGDGGAHQPFDKYLYKEAPYPLHPIQFRELCAQVIYKESLRDRTPKYVSFAPDDGKPMYVQLPLFGFSFKPYYRDWNPAVYAKYLSHYTGVDYRDICHSGDRVRTWLSDENGKPIYLSL